MKISIITTTLNNDKTIAYTLSSVFSQTYKNIEHVIVDGGSTDETLNILRKHKIKKKILHLEYSSVYEAINYGIKKCSGDFVVILNSDNILHEPDTIKKVVKIIKANKKNTIIIGSVSFYNSNKFNEKIREYPSKGFKFWMFRFGNMPSHQGAFVPIKIAQSILYDENFSIASNFDFFLRIFLKKNYIKLIDNIITRMRITGISNKNIYSHFRTSSEINISLKKNKIYSNYLFIYFRFFLKIYQYFYIKKNNYKFKIKLYYKKLLKYDIKILKEIKFLNLNKNFVLSALNLAFVGNLLNKKIKIYNELIHWPDGLFSKTIIPNINKIAGRKLLEDLRLNNNIKRIVVFGNLPYKSEIFLQKKFNKPIKNYGFPYRNIIKHYKKLKFVLKKTDLLFITLPTPKQEQLAEQIVLKNKKFKIICIGGSINIASGIETAVPNFFNNYEYIWRLRKETARRLKRLLQNIFYYLKDKYIFKTSCNLTYKIIK